MWNPDIHPLSKNKDMEIPKVAGRLWIVPKYACLTPPHKPSRFYLFWMRVFFGFEWEDIKHDVPR